MKKPVIAKKSSSILKLEPGTYYWCSCGKSKKQPFCDGAHKGSEFTPMPFDIEETKKVPLCNCKYTNDPPYCDGFHRDLD